ncbi:haloacid dehalogenase-like hydrolase [Stieleria sp. TO1_6]|uniref:HAD family hydrolase n=1 Tax=Stieleria tagensis TaxID=2956795 RepID=UPI00209B731D|nr:HAD family hydrolase [Stieleria tagensis]MCO8123779.1 haloacid dehalogenase-like hydrolase [Stieleria tagensis]
MNTLTYRLLLLLALSGFAVASDAADPLPSWNDGDNKSAIISYVQKVTEAGSSDFVPQADRLAVFDNDGTLWTEAPLPLQVDFMFHEVKRRAAIEPDFAAEPMVKAALAGDTAKLLENHYAGLLKLLELTHTGITTDEFQRRVKAWIPSFQQPKGGKGLAGATFQPMLELLEYLRANGFKTYIVSGGGIDFMRVFAEQLYGIPPEQVIGSSMAVKFEMMNDAVPTLIKTNESLFVDDKLGKPVGIYRHIGRRPIFCGGNSDGDQAMLEYTTIDNPYPSFGLIVHHTDAQRETAYDKKPPASGTLIHALEAAPEQGWHVIDMKADWKTVFKK